MSLIDIPLDRIDQDDLRRLIATKAAESVYIDYKAATYGPTGEQHREFLADLSSFANTAGGDIVIGMTEENGIPTGFKPFSDYPDVELRRLDDMARSGLQPTISNLLMRAVSSPQGGHVIVVRIPRSYHQPHRVIHTNSNRFWARSSASPKKYEPNVEELRQIFNDIPLLAERIRSFRIDRLAKITAEESSVLLGGRCLLALHVVPYSAFGLGASVSVDALVDQWELFPPLGRPRGTHRYVNFEGFVVLSNANPVPVAPQPSYAQVFRSGAIEAVATIDRGDGKLWASDIDKYCVHSTTRYVTALSRFGIGCPIAVLASLLGARGKTLDSGITDWYAEYGVLPIGYDQLLFTEAIFENVVHDYRSCAANLRPLLEQVWNTAGFAHINTIDQNGNYLFRM